MILHFTLLLALLAAGFDDFTWLTVTCCISMFEAGGFSSTGLTFGFLGLLWGRGRLLAPPTVSAGLQRQEQINIPSSSVQQLIFTILQTVAVVSSTDCLFVGSLWSTCFPEHYSSTFCPSLSLSAPYLLLPASSTVPETDQTKGSGETA